MIRKLALALMLCSILMSCGKKGDPEYKEPEKKVKIQLLLINKA